MDRVIDKTKRLIDAFENDELMKMLDYYKNRIVMNKDLLDMIRKYNDSEDNSLKLSLKEKIYKYDDYKEYMKYYNELFYYVLMINKKFREYTHGSGCI